MVYLYVKSYRFVYAMVFHEVNYEEFVKQIRNIRTINISTNASWEKGNIDLI